MNTILDVRRKIREELKKEGIDDSLYPGLVTNLTSIAIEWADTAIEDFRTHRLS
jgi:hypothetical protein